MTKGILNQSLPNDINGLAAAFDAIDGAATSIMAIENQPRAGDVDVLGRWLTDLHGLKSRIVDKLERIIPMTDFDADRKRDVLVRHALNCGRTGAELLQVVAKAASEAVAVN